MPDLREQLEHCCRRACLVGVGNGDFGDDGAGVRLAEKLAADLRFTIFDLRVLVAGTAPEQHLTELKDGGLDHVIFLDAVEFGGEPGSVVLLDAQQMAGRFPQVSTHRISLGTLAQWIEANGTTRVWLLGVQPASLRAGAGLSPAVQRTVENLKALLDDILISVVAPGRRSRPSQSAIGNQPSAISC